MKKIFQKSSLGLGILIATLLLFDLACLFDPTLLDRTLRRLDFRLWPSWYFLGIAIVLVGLFAKKSFRKIFTVAFTFLCVSGSLNAAEKKIVQLEPPRRVSAAAIRESSQAKSEENVDGGYNANISVIDSFAAMEYRSYTGGRYVNEPVKFRMLFPDGFDPPTASKRPGGRRGEAARFPLLICFHGMGESGNDNSRQLAHLQSTLDLLAGKNKLDLFVLVTQCPEDNPYWDVSVSDEGKGDAPLTILEEIFETVLDEFPIDREKLCVYGHCSGGNAAWKFVDSHPNQIAALVVCSARPDRVTPENFLKTAIWAFHNKDDTTSPIPTQEIVEEINALGGNAYLTLHETGGHDSWTGALGEDKAVGWMVYQMFGKPGPPQGVICYHRSSGTFFILFVLPVLLIAATIVYRLRGVRKLS